MGRSLLKGNADSGSERRPGSTALNNAFKMLWIDIVLGVLGVIKCHVVFVYLGFKTFEVTCFS